MTTIYIVKASGLSGGSYDDSWENNLIASLDRARAEEHIKNLEAENARIKDAVEKCIALQRVMDTAYGPLKREPLIPTPKWKAGLGKEQITQEMKNELLNVQLQNEQISKRNHAVSEEYWDKIKARKNEFLLTLGFEPDHELLQCQTVYRSEEVYYEIEEIELI